MTLLAEGESKSVESTQMRYISTGSQLEREFDACYYLIKKSETITDGRQLKFVLRKNVEMNVYIYEGNSRENAKKSLVESNEQPIIDQEYVVAPDSGILVVAFPNEEKETDLAFDYWVEIPEPPP